ncbi:hypothetical protein GCM10010317_074620 [Streptomyces mirabilis]|uniref:hypothetical protein n=1 Tax=Streptomyces mirabilis TaxID=68239 RepID=UPI00167D0770|nr:hypothetical protein [Streptomyces mirabilis]GHD69284.1 hypothetical protein GCM10010317_074620 [Streptomyces mirabilis]
MALAFDGVRGFSPLTPDARGTERSPPVFTPRPRSRPTGRRGVAHGIRLTAYEWRVPVPERRADATDGVADAGADADSDAEDSGQAGICGDVEICEDVESCGDVEERSGARPGLRPLTGARRGRGGVHDENCRRAPQHV